MSVILKLKKLSYTNPNSYLILKNAYTSLKWRKKLSEGKVTHKLIEPLMEAIKLGEIKIVKANLLKYGCTIENFEKHLDLAIEKLSSANNIPKDEIIEWVFKSMDYEPEKGDREESRLILSKLKIEKGYSLESLSNDMEKPQWLEKVKSGKTYRPVEVALKDAISKNFLRFVEEELIDLGYPDDLLQKQIDKAVNEMAKDNNMDVSELWRLIDVEEKRD
jgi:hypothetical protein